MKQICILAGFALLLFGCNNTQTNQVQMDDTTVGRKEITTTWIKYDTPVGGYDILMHCKQDEVGSGYFTTDYYLSKDGKTLSFQQTISFDQWEPWCLEGLTEKDTQFIHNTHVTSVTQKIDWHNILYFEDMDFDGESEMVICGHVSPQRIYEKELDCEDFFIYKIVNNEVKRIRNIPFDLLSEGQCRTGFLFDRQKKCLTLIKYCTFYLTVTETYWFKNGQVYAMNYEVVNDKEEGKHNYHWDVRDIESGYVNRWMDSIREQGHYY